MLTVVGIVLIGLGGELVARGAIGLIAHLGVPALLMGMVVTPAAVEIEEIFARRSPPRKDATMSVRATLSARCSTSRSATLAWSR